MNYTQKYLVMTLIISGITSAGYTATYAETSRPNNHIELLFFQQAKLGSIKPITKTTNCYKLTLRNLHPHITYFANSPNHKAGTLSLAQFLQTLKHNQKIENIKPNAVLTMIENTKNESIPIHRVGTLSNACYYHRTFQYTLCLFKNNPVIKAGELREVNLFIDPIHRWPP